MRALVALVLFAFALTGCGAMMESLGEAMVAASTERTDRLSTTNRVVGYVDRMPPEDIDIAEFNWIKDIPADSPVVSFSMPGQSGLSFNALNGEATAAGIEMTEGLGGARYVAVPDGSDPVELRIASASGETETYVLDPLPPIRVTSVNGTPVGQGVTLSPDDPLVLELDRRRLGRCR